MRQLVMILLTALCFNAVALDAVGLLTPSPLGVVLAYNTYLKDQKKVYYIRVQSQARDFEQAKKQAFRLASEQVAGTVLLSESELRNSNLTRDEVITYSSGIVDEYRIVDRFDSADGVRLTVDIWIADSVMAQRVLARSATERGIDGAAMSARVDSILDERQRGEALIRAVLYDYPKRAFQVTMSQPNVNMDIVGNAYSEIEWEVSWDQRYVDAFQEAAKQTGQKPCVWKCPSGPQFFLNGYWSLDPGKINAVVDHAKNVRATMQIELQNIHGVVVRRSCQPLSILRQQWGSPYPNSAMITEYPTWVTVGGKQPLKGRARFAIGKNLQTITNLGQFRAEVVAELQCQTM